jgi:hypothetical protein
MSVKRGARSEELEAGSGEHTKDIQRRLLEAATRLKVLSEMNERGGLSPAQIDGLVDALLQTTEAISQLLRARHKLLPSSKGGIRK